MPRIAAALGVLAALALSIGFNTLRYPVVWNMVAPSAAGAQRESASPAIRKVQDAAPAAQPARPAEPAVPARSASLPPASPVKSACDPHRGICQLPAETPEKPNDTDAKKPAETGAKAPAATKAPAAEKAKPSARPNGAGPDQKTAAAVASKPRRPPAKAEKTAQPVEPPATPEKVPDQIGMMDSAAQLVPVVRPRNTPRAEPAEKPSPPAPLPQAGEGTSGTSLAQAGEGRREHSPAPAGEEQAVVRLPPVDERDAWAPPAVDPSALDGQMPIYPTTGVQ